MKTRICMLRGINVSGKNTISMAALKTMLKKAGGTDISTYIRSGNVIFNDTTTLSAEDWEERIGKDIETTFGHREIGVFLSTKEELREVLQALPFKDADTKILYFTFTKQKPGAGLTAVLEAFRKESERICISDRGIYLCCPKGYGITKLSNNLLEKKLNTRATTRNRNTLQKLIQIADNTEKLC
ncbi:Uncharacterized conserved protein, DUF1697 family [Sinomicrobium oceani]|uniref:Uncharacterized conserved protein, DUF1697 family n=1 Tax=Sinomicrobium oceani TaxID=1150368 RepID=A0A1K1QN52_9FLAO|nr:DUF1697 domain-containing protein [Sinomicrobium oceani]SFW61043.1 Uncharacterized conserved protein, DUF1697 family [Sinomicrobium oceani]